MIKINKNKKGFTIIELLITMAIMGLLATLAIMSLNSARVKSRDSKRLSDISELRKALEIYYHENGHFPISTNCPGVSTPANGWCNSVETISASGWHWIHDNGTANAMSSTMPFEPKDPLQKSTAKWLPEDGGTLYYFSAGYGGPGQWYMLVFGLENHNDLENTDGVTACDGTYFHYGNATNKVITIGSNCVK